MPALAARTPATRATTPNRPTALTLLLTRYLAGQIEEARWAAISESLDAVDADPSERVALAAFCLDASKSGEVPALPEVDEVNEFLLIGR